MSKNYDVFGIVPERYVLLTQSIKWVGNVPLLW
jgi:hypothetical protein